MIVDRLTQFDLVVLIRHHSAHARACKLSALACQEAAWNEDNDNMADVSRALARDAWGHFYLRRGMVLAFSTVLALMRRRKVAEIGAEKDTWKASDLSYGMEGIERRQRDALDRAKSLMPNWP